MIYIFTALYWEAELFIESCGLKKVQQGTRFQQFYSEPADILLTITGIGEIAAAAAVGSVCTQHRPGDADFLLNAGVCAGPAGKKGIFLGNRLTEQTTGKTFYPDILYRHRFQEAEIITGMRPLEGGMDAVHTAGAASDVHGTAGGTKGFPDHGCRLYDMEAAAVYQAGAYFFGPHQMIFLKLISDDGSAGGVSGRQIQQLMAGQQEAFAEFLAQLARIAGDISRQQAFRPPGEEELTEKVCRDMHATKAMGDLLRQQIRYLALTGTDPRDVIAKMYEEQLLPCRDKREGKKCFAEFKKRLF